MDPKNRAKPKIERPKSILKQKRSTDITKDFQSSETHDNSPFRSNDQQDIDNRSKFLRDKSVSFNLEANKTHQIDSSKRRNSDERLKKKEKYESSDEEVCTIF